MSERSECMTRGDGGNKGKQGDKSFSHLLKKTPQTKAKELERKTMSSRALLCGFPAVDTCFLAQMVVYEIIAFVLTDAPDANTDLCNAPYHCHHSFEEIEIACSTLM